MLTKNDEKWLEGRKSLCARCDCYIDHLAGTASCWDGMRKGWEVADCKMFCRSDVTHADFEDAAKFEAMCSARVCNGVFYDWVEKFGFEVGPGHICKEWGLTPSGPECKNCRRSHAECQAMWCRILTEMEMPI